MASSQTPYNALPFLIGTGIGTAEPSTTLPNYYKPYLKDEDVTISLVAQFKSRYTHNLNNSLSIATHRFTASTKHLLPAYLTTELENTQGLVLVIIEGYVNFLLDFLDLNLDKFPDHLLSALFPERFSGNKRTVVVPTLSQIGDEMSFLLDNIAPATLWGQEWDYSRRQAEEATNPRHHIPLAAWIKLSNAFKQAPAGVPDRPIAIVLGPPNEHLLARMSRHYTEHNCARFKRLAQCPFWLYVDIFHIFTQWTPVLQKSQQILAEAEFHSLARKLPVLQRTRQLHKAMADLIKIAEYLRIHEASTTKLKRDLSGLDKTKHPLTSPMKFDQLLLRLESHIALLDHYATTCRVMKEQTHNLMNLEFNTESVRQAQSVARLSALAFIFIPLSFAASLWGMTQFTVSPKYLPAAAIPLLAGTLAAAWLSGKVITMWEARQSSVQYTKYGLPNLSSPDLSFSHLEKLEDYGDMKRFKSVPISNVTPVIHRTPGAFTPMAYPVVPP